VSVSATEAVTTPGPTTSTGFSAVSPSTTAAAEDKQMFLELMVAQLRYQDPLNPTDSSQMLAQSAQFTALEKMQEVADQTAMVASSQLAFGASSLIGTTVRWTDTSGVEQSGTVQGATFGVSGPVLSVDGNEVPLFAVASVGDAPTIAPSGPDGSTDDYTPPAGTPPTGSTTARAAV
jgi:flagellar basal-body rod modification protein FlgD